MWNVYDTFAPKLQAFEEQKVTRAKNGNHGIDGPVRNSFLKCILRWKQGWKSLLIHWESIQVTMFVAEGNVRVKMRYT